MSATRAGTALGPGRSRDGNAEKSNASTPFGAQLDEAPRARLGITTTPSWAPIPGPAPRSILLAARVRCLVALPRIGVEPLSGRDCWPQGQSGLHLTPIASPPSGPWETSCVASPESTRKDRHLRSLHRSTVSFGRPSFAGISESFDSWHRTTEIVVSPVRVRVSPSQILHGSGIFYFSDVMRRLLFGHSIAHRGASAAVIVLVRKPNAHAGFGGPVRDQDHTIPALGAHGSSPRGILDTQHCYGRRPEA